MEVITVISIMWFTHSASSSLSKCCPSNFELFFKNSNDDELILREDIICQPASTVATLAVGSSTYFHIRFPTCSKLKLVNVYQKSAVVCIDRISPLNSIFGLTCADTSELKEDWIPMPSVTNFRKCCPYNRKYDVEKQFCWSPLSDNYTKAVPDLLKLAKRGKNVFVNVTIGTPTCRDSEALLDTVVPANQLIFNSADALRFTSSGLLFSLDEYCVDLVDDLFEYIVVRSCWDSLSTCKHDQVCVRKCCPDAYEMQKRSCVPSKRPISLQFHNRMNNGGYVAVDGIRPAFLSRPKCPNGKYPLNRDDPTDSHVLTVENRVVMLFHNRVFGIDEFCVDNLYQMEGTRIVICLNENLSPFPNKMLLKTTLTTLCSAVSAIFLFLTFIIYAALPSLQNLHSKLIMCYLITSASSYAVVVWVRIFPYWFWYHSQEICTLSGYLMLFSFLSSFSWLNVISYDIWSTFKAVRSLFLKKSKTNKRFSFCCLYGWGFPGLWTIFAACCQLIPSKDTPNSIWKPDIGNVSCWFGDYGLSKIPFFIVPVSFMFIFNIVLFIVTVKYCANIKSQLKLTHSTTYSLKKYTADMNEFMINIKLFILMGLNWTMELISLMVQPHNRMFFILSDVMNASEGTIIFCLFVLKRKVLRDLRKILCGNNSKTAGIERATRYTTSTTSSTIQNMMNSRRSVNIFP